MQERAPGLYDALISYHHPSTLYKCLILQKERLPRYDSRTLCCILRPNPPFPCCKMSSFVILPQIGPEILENNRKVLKNLQIWSSS